RGGMNSTENGMGPGLGRVSAWRMGTWRPTAGDGNSDMNRYLMVGTCTGAGPAPRWARQTAFTVAGAAPRRDAPATRPTTVEGRKVTHGLPEHPPGHAPAGRAGSRHRHAGGGLR